MRDIGLFLLMALAWLMVMGMLAHTPTKRHAPDDSSRAIHSQL